MKKLKKLRQELEFAILNEDTEATWDVIERLDEYINIIELGISPAHASEYKKMAERLLGGKQSDKETDDMLLSTVKHLTSKCDDYEAEISSMKDENEKLHGQLDIVNVQNKILEKIIGIRAAKSISS